MKNLRRPMNTVGRHEVSPSLALKPHKTSYLRVTNSTFSILERLIHLLEGPVTRPSSATRVCETRRHDDTTTRRHDDTTYMQYERRSCCQPVRIMLLYPSARVSGRSLLMGSNAQKHDQGELAVEGRQGRRSASGNISFRKRKSVHSLVFWLRKIFS